MAQDLKDVFAAWAAECDDRFNRRADLLRDIRSRRSFELRPPS